MACEVPTRRAAPDGRDRRLSLLTIRVYVEGGGRGSKATCRKAFRTLLQKLVPDKRIEIIASGSRDDALSDFGLALAQRPGQSLYLVIDSEDHVSNGHQPLDHLRKQGKTVAGAQDHQVHLMVQCMEAWFLADRPTLRSYFGNAFAESSLPANPNVEAIPKTDVLRSLDRAARNVPKREYDKGRDAFELLSRIDPSLIRRSSRHAERLFAAIEQDP